MEPTVTLARRLWTAIEPIHAVVYFAPEVLEAARKTGLRGFWMSYFASRVAPLGALPAPAVEAMTYGFSPAIVARAIPDAWRFASPEAVLEARLGSAPLALRQHAGDIVGAPAAELADLLWEAVQGCRFDGRRTRYRRFHGCIRVFPRQYLAEALSGSPVHHALVACAGSAGAGPGGQVVALASCRLVEDAWQRRGLGSALLDELARHARGLGPRALTAQLLAEEQWAAGLLRRYGSGQPGVLRDHDPDCPAGQPRAQLSTCGGSVRVRLSSKK
jgi:GNAT superfamily N-acetyltransferase